MEQLAKKRIMVLGATGSVGRATCEALHNTCGAHVIAVDRNAEKLQALNRDIPLARTCLRDVTSSYHCRELSKHTNLDAIVYTVGHCPPNGFKDAVTKPIDSPSTTNSLIEELELHVLGLHRVFSHLLPNIRKNGHIVVINSAIVNVDEEQCPSWLQAGHYATAKAAQAQLIKWMRMSSQVRQNNIQIHSLAPTAIDTPFHSSTTGKNLISIEDVTREILFCLISQQQQDKVLTSYMETAR